MKMETRHRPTIDDLHTSIGTSTSTLSNAAVRQKQHVLCEVKITITYILKKSILS